MNHFYLTTTLPYVNADPHIGFALELVQADAIARHHKIIGENIFFNTGTDEHGQKIYEKAKAAGINVQKYCDQYAAKFKELIPALGITSEIHFIRTTDEHHIAAAQEFWKRCEKNGDIEKKIYKVKYCVGCELEKTESDLDDNGRCLIHPHLDIELIEEENYFFKFSKYQKPLLDFYSSHPDFVVPSFRFNEIKEFVKRGLQDFSISRLKAKMPWGVPVPGDDSQVMYVWFDALINYISTLGWPLNSVERTADSVQEGAQSERYTLHATRFQDFWPGVQIAGKDNLRQQSAMWQAMLMSAGLPNSKQIIIHGFITSGGQKMSKSLGNVADPYDIISKLKSLGLNDEQATDALRYYLLREIPTFEDGDFTWEKFVESYNSGLANGIGNLTSRILKMAANSSIKSCSQPIHGLLKTADKSVTDHKTADKSANYINHYELQKSLDAIWQKISSCDQFIQKEEPFKVIKTNPEKGKKDIEFLLTELFSIALSLQPFLPKTAEKIMTHLIKFYSKSSAEASAEADNAINNITLENIPKLFPRIKHELFS